MRERSLVKIRERGQVTLPASMRRKLGFKDGDLVAVLETPDGVLITRREQLAARAFDQIGAALRKQGLSLDELIESGREERAAILDERDGRTAPPAAE